MINPDEINNLIKIIHKGCGKTAFYYTHIPKIGEIIEHGSAILIDGSYPNTGDPMICGSCQKGISHPDLTCKENPT